MLNLVPDLADTEDALDLILDFTTDADLDDEDYDDSDDAIGLLELLVEAGVSLEALSTLLAEDPLSGELLVDSTYNDPNGLTSLQSLIQESEDPLAFGDFFASLVTSDPNGADLFLVVSSESDELTQALNETLADDPELASLIYDRLKSSPAALETLQAEAEDSPNALILFTTTLATEDDPQAGEFLLEVLATNDTIAQNFLLAVNENPSTLSTLQGLLTDLDGLADGLVGLSALTADLDAFGQFLSLLGEDETLSALLQDAMADDPNLSAFLNEDDAVETAPVVEQPIVEEQPAVEEQPVIEEQPIVEEQPAPQEQPQDGGGGDGGGGDGGGGE